jgi:hypothetical protein
METTIDRNFNKGRPHRYQEIEGWGIDADSENDPTYPMKNANGADHERLNYERTSQQPLNVEVLHSNERLGVTRVFGTSTPPKGLSGMLRRYAFQFSEGSSAHWLSLLLADRIDVVQGVIDDLKHGHIPNFFAERGWKAEWKYNRKGVIRKAAVQIAIASAVVVLLVYRNKGKKLSVKSINGMSYR